MMEHLFGPWDFADEPNGKQDTVIEYRGCPLVTVRGTDDMSCIDDEDEDEIAKDCIATANLVRAAPDMLRVLKNVLPYLKATGTNGTHWVPEVIEAMRKAETFEYDPLTVIPPDDYELGN